MTYLSQFIRDRQHAYPGATGAFSDLLHTISVATKHISKEIRSLGLGEKQGLTGVTNPSGDEVKGLDEYANQTIIGHLQRSGLVRLIATEEEDQAIQCPKGPYAVLVDPLDGSNNIDYYGSVGSIFSIYRSETGTLDDILVPGREQVASLYVLYGSSTVLVYTAQGETVHEFTLAPDIGEFLLSREGIAIPSCKEYCVNEGNYHYWKEGQRRLIDSLKSDPKGPFALRYFACLVADFHRILTKGGLFMYPEDNKKGAWSAKLRYLFEAAPLALIAEQAGGGASTGMMRILDHAPSALHERVPLYLGSKNLIGSAEGFLQEKKEEE